MKIASGAADRFVQAPDGKIAAVLLYGPDRGLARERAGVLLKAWGIDPNDPFSVTEIGEDLIKSDVARLADELRAMTLTGGARVVRIRGGDAIAATIKSVIGAIDDGSLIPSAKLLVDGGDLASRSKLRAVFEAAGRAAAAPCYEDDARALGGLLDAALKDAKLTMTPEARARALPQLEGDRALARAEIEKLILYKGPGAPGNDPGPITPEDVDAIAAGAEPVALDDVIDAALGGDVAAADRAVSLAAGAGVGAVTVVRALQRRLYQLHGADAVYRKTKSLDAAMKTLRPPLFGPRQATFRAQLSVWSGVRLDGAIGEALRAETKLKSAGAAEDALLGRLMLALAGQAKRAKR